MMEKMDTLEGKTAIVTGPSKGIGQEIALALVENGADLVINGNNQEQLEYVRAQVETLGSRCRVVRRDISDSDMVTRLAAVCMEAFGKIDILVDNAGVNSRIPSPELMEEGWRRMAGTDLDGTFYCCKAVLSHMMHQQPGTIINISSTASKMTHANMPIYYGAFKAAVNSMTQKLARGVGLHHIRINGIYPRPIETDMSPQWTEEYRRDVVRKIPLGLLGTTRNVADVTVLLASDMAGFISGETISVNGGSYMN